MLKLVSCHRSIQRERERVIKFVQYVFGYVIVKLNDLANFKNGKGHEGSVDESGKYIVVNSKFISSNGKVRKYSDKNLCPLYVDDVLCVMSDLPNGKALGKCYIVEENDKYTLNQRICSLSFQDNPLVNSKYMYYFLSRNSQFLRYDNGVDQTNLKKSDILNIDVVLPTMNKQCDIVSKFDKFEKLNKDIQDGLPAEIEVRQKQYEYYRDELLTFKEKKSA